MSKEAAGETDGLAPPVTVKNEVAEEATSEAPLRRSQRKKFHLDISALRSHRNPDRRLSPSPPPAGRAAATTQKRAVLAPTASLPHPTTAAANRRAEKQSGASAPKTSVKKEAPPVACSEPSRHKARGRSKIVEPVPMNCALEMSDGDQDSVKEHTCSEDTIPPPPVVSKTRADVARDEGTPPANAATVKEEASPEAAQTPPLIPEQLKVEVFEREELQEEESSSEEAKEAAEGEENARAIKVDPPRSSATVTIIPAIAGPYAVTLTSPATSLSATLPADAEMASSSTAGAESGKRKRKPPLHYRDFQPTSTNEGSEEEQDEEIFKSAKIEYTNADGSKSLDDYACTKCPAQFESRVGLTNHMKLHGANKEYPCEICDFSCTNKKTMRVHRKIHGVHKKGDSPRKKQPASSSKGAEDTPGSSTTVSSSEKQSVNHGEDVEGLKRSPPTLPLYRVESAAEPGEGGMRPPATALEAMPILESEVGAAASSTATNDEDSNGSNATASSKRISGNANGSKERSTKGLAIKCPECPFRTRSQQRLTPHLGGHTRQSGYRCPMCSFKTESAGFLRRHCDLHGQSYTWPPAYVGLPQDELNDLLLRGDPVALSDAAKGKDAQLKQRKSDRKSKPPTLYSSIPPPELLPRRRKDDRTIECRAVEGCEFRCDSTRELICHQLVIHKTARKLVHRDQHICKQCGASIKGYGALTLHKKLFHRCVRRQTAERQKLYRQLLDERLQATQFRPSMESTGVDPTEAAAAAEVSAKTSDAGTPQPQTAANASVEKTFKCSHCPFTADQVTKLERHENKHLVKSEHQCPECSFSCRGEDTLQQHLRLHSNKPTSPDDLTPSEEDRQPGETGDEAPSGDDGSASQSRKSDVVLACNECPYKSKHGCDMKAHKAMHTMPPRTYACPKCTYSTLRENALKTHELLHEGVQPQHLRNRQRRSVAAKMRRLKLKSIRGKALGMIGWKMKKEGGAPDGTMLRMFYRCRFCPTELRWMEELFRHARHHFIEAATDYACDMCSFKTDIEARLDEHFDRAHSKLALADGASGGDPRLMPFKCSECPFACNTYGKLWHHQQKHRKASRFSCNKCSFSAGSIQCLSEHVQLHTNRPGEENSSGGRASVAATITTSPNPAATDVTQNAASAVGVEGDSLAPVEGVSPAANADAKVKETRKRRREKKSIDRVDQSVRKRAKRKVQEREPVKEVSIPSPTETACTTRTRRTSKRGRPAAGASVEAEPPPSAKRPFTVKKSVVKLAIEIPPAQARITRNLQLLARMDEDASTTDAPDSAATSDSSTCGRLRSCSECPFTCHDRILHKFHLGMHVKRNRPHKCTMCSFNCYNVESLHAHLGLHAPPLSPSSSIQVRKRHMGRNKNGSYQNLVEMLPPNAPPSAILQCSQCSYRTLTPEKLHQHRLEHVQLLQQRLGLTIKRSVNDELSGKLRMRRVVKKKERQMLSCSICCFRCDSVQAFVGHRENHGMSAIFKCSLCNYASNTANVLLYHEGNHHLEGSLTDICNSNDRLKGVGYRAESAAGPVPSLRCTKQCGFFCYEADELERHWSACHMGATASVEDREIGELLRMRSVPREFLTGSNLHSSP